eukprot:Lankesteria_metandrocarpae@DN874_c0_g1_i1.p1
MKCDNEKLMELYALAHAPLSSNSLLEDLKDLGPEDMSPDLLADEVAFVNKLQSLCFERFQSYYELYRDVEPRCAPQDIGAAINCLATFLKRAKTLNESLLELTEHLASQHGDCSSTLKGYEAAARKDNKRPLAVENFEELLDFTPNRRWNVPDEDVGGKAAAAQGKVGFNETTSVLTGQNKVSEEALKVTGTTRKKHRNPTGYQKFTFRDLGLSEADVLYDDGMSGPVSTTASSLAGRDSRTSSEGEISARSVANECMRQEELNPFNKADRQNSLVSFSSDNEREEIEDDMADPEWSTLQRHTDRYSRIRGRVPTGHPSMIKRGSDEIAKMLAELDTEELGHDDVDHETLKNTNRNTSVSAPDV